MSGHNSVTAVTAAATDAKYGFVIVKATEGEGYDSPSYPSTRQVILDAGKLVGAYHFAWPNQDPVAEAEHFVQYADLGPGGLACLDVENWGDATIMGATPWTTRVAFALTWLREVKRLTGATPLVYANWDWIKGLRTAATLEQWDELVTYPLWIAQYRDPGTFDTVDPKPGSVNGWPVVMHQWTNDDNGLDGDWVQGAAADVWAKYATPKEQS